MARESAETLQYTLNHFHPIEEEIKINWGNSGFNANDPREVFGNKCEAVYRSARKDVFFQLCKKMGTVPVVKEEDEYSPGYFIHDDPTGHNGGGVRYLGVGEPHIVVLKAIQEGKLVTKQIKGTEYRVYFCYNMVPKIYMKVPLTEDTPENPIQNSHNGYGYLSNPPSLKRIENLKEILLSSTKEVADKLELSYGAIDFIVSTDYTVYILESNSAPTLFSEELVDGFAEHIARRFK
jgi:hypothetical protein